MGDRRSLICFRLLLAAAACPAFASAADVETEASYRFLIGDLGSGGILQTIGAGPLKGQSLPLSFRDSAEYWGEYVCKTAGATCAVIDVYNASDYTLRPNDGPAGDLQTERINVHNGANIYDAATWQIAVMLGAQSDTLGQNAYELVGRQTRLLEQSGHRAPSQGEVFVYNGHRFTAASQAYAFRMLAQNWLADDPFMGTRYDTFVSARALPIGNSDYRAGKVSWSDWKPITGENAWAFLIGPLQAAYLHYVKNGRRTFIPFHDVAVQSALDVLPAFAAMQSPIGAVYYAPAGAAGSRDPHPTNPHEVSVENNFSLYAGLKLFEATLRAEMAHQKDLNARDKNKIDAALESIDLMINGGHQTAGLLGFFKNAAWRNGEFVQGGLANDPGQDRDWIPQLDTKAVDVTTWGIAALGAQRIDAWFGFGAAYRTWQQVKGWGAYGVKQILWGVGYSDRDGNGMDAEGAYKSGVLSSEWTAGAITMIRNMMAYYRSIPMTSKDYAGARAYLLMLQQDETAMLAGLQSLRFDRYQITPFPGKPDRYADLLRSKPGAFVYASKRYAIPFGWYANPLPSTCATAWFVMVANHYDPFGYAGRPN